MLDKSEYILDIMEGLCEAGKKNLITASEHKRLADNLVDNAGADMIAAERIEADWDTRDIFEGVNYYDR